MYSTVATPYRDYIRDVARAMRKEVEHLCAHHKRRREVEKKSVNLVNCITSVVGEVCRECGEPAPASGHLVGTGQRCNARTCPRCARRRAAAYRDLGERIERKCTPIVDTWSWKMITITARYDKASEDDLTVEALRGRYVGLRKAWRAVFEYLKELARDQGQDDRRVGALCAVELVGTGYVHLHALALCPFVDRFELPRRAFAGWSGAGTCDVKMVDAGAIGEVAKYPIKTPGAAGEAWIGGAKCYDVDKETGEVVGGLVHPRLAARWELALSHRRVLDRYGAFRGVPLNEKNVTELPEPPPPCRCGSHKFRKVVEDPRVWIRRFARTGQDALATPRAIRKRDGEKDHGREHNARDGTGAGVGEDRSETEGEAGAEGEAEA